MEPQEQKQFNLFKEEVMKYESIDSNLMSTLLNRYCSVLRKRRFFNDTHKLRYYSYWIKMLVKMGILEVRGLGYKVLK